MKAILEEQIHVDRYTGWQIQNQWLGQPHVRLLPYLNYQNDYFLTYGNDFTLLVGPFLFGAG